MLQKVSRISEDTFGITHRRCSRVKLCITAYSLLGPEPLNLFSRQIFRTSVKRHIYSRNDIAVRTDQRGEAWLPEGFFLECQCGLQQRRAVPSSHPADRERLRRRLLQVSTQNGSDDGATFVWIITA